MREMFGERRVKALALGVAVLAAVGLTFAFAQKRTGRRAPAEASAPAPAGGPRTIKVGARGNLQKALDEARPGDTITVEAGATFAGPFVLPDKKSAGTDADWITIRTSTPDDGLPPGRRVSPAQAGLMPKLLAPGNAGIALRSGPGAHHYRVIGIEFMPVNDTADVRNIVWLSDDTDSRQPEQQPHHITLDRCYVHGLPASETLRGIALNGKHLAVVNSYVSDIKHTWQDSQAVWGYVGGPFLIENNFLEAAGENILFGGSDPPTADLIPSDIVIRRNHLSKPNRWRHDSPEYGGKAWAVKNLLEIKNGRRILIEGNLIENVWKHHQTGVAVLLKATNQYGKATFNTCEDVLFQHNVIRHAATAIQLATNEGPQGQPTAGTKNIKIVNNLAYDISRVRYAQGAIEGDFIGTNILATDVLIDRNTVGDVDMKIMRLADPNHPRFSGLTITNNVFSRGNNTGIGLESSVTEGRWAFENWGTGVTYRNNLMFNAGLDYAENPVAPKYPAGNFFTPKRAQDIFVNVAAGNYRLRPDSPYKGKGTDRRDLGCDIDALEAAMAGVAAAGAATSPPDATPERAPSGTAPAQRPRTVGSPRP